MATLVKKKTEARLEGEMKDWAISFISAVLVVGLIVWCVRVVIPLFR